MKLDGFEIDKYKDGWRLVTWYLGRDKNGNERLQKKPTFYSHLEMTLKAVLDKAAGGCTTTEELLRLLGNANGHIDYVVRSNGLVRTPIRQRNRIDAKTRRRITQDFIDGEWVTTFIDDKCGKIYLQRASL